MVGESVQSPLGPGFESQVPQIFVIIFIQVIACDSAGVAYHGPSFRCLPDGPRPDQVVQIERAPHALVNQCTWESRSQPGLLVLGHQNCCLNLPKSGPTSNSLYFLIYFFILFNYFYYLITNQLIFFLIKSKNQKIYFIY